MFCDIYNIFVSAIFSTPTFRFTDLQLTYLISVFFFGGGGGWGVLNAAVLGLADCVNYVRAFCSTSLRSRLVCSTTDIFSSTWSPIKQGNKNSYCIYSCSFLSGRTEGLRRTSVNELSLVSF